MIFSLAEIRSCLVSKLLSLDLSSCHDDFEKQSDTKKLYKVSLKMPLSSV